MPSRATSTTNTRTLRVLADAEAAPEIDRIIGAWPDTSAPPSPVFHAAADVEDRLSDDPAIVVLRPGSERHALYQLADALHGSRAPAVVIGVGADDAEMFRSEGVAAFEADADPVLVATTLWAMIQRQPVVDRLSLELRLAQSTLGGAQSEMDRYQEEMQLAATVQREFIPRTTPQVAGVELGVLYRPAGYVSGDIYDLAQLDDRHLAFFVADAVGHGVPAALFTLVIAKSLHKTRPGRDGVPEIVEPSEVLAILNRELGDRPGADGRFATAVYGVLDVRSGSMTVAGAGHPPPILRRATGDIERIESDGPLLGVFDGAAYGQTSVTLDPGDVLVLFSDGFETAFPANNASGRELRLPTLTYLDKLAETGSHALDMRAAIEQLAHDLDAQAGSLHQADDVTALLVARTGIGDQ